MVSGTDACRADCQRAHSTPSVVPTGTVSLRSVTAKVCTTGTGGEPGGRHIGNRLVAVRTGEPDQVGGDPSHPLHTVGQDHIVIGTLGARDPQHLADPKVGQRSGTRPAGAGNPRGRDRRRLREDIEQCRRNRARDNTIEP